MKPWSDDVADLLDDAARVERLTHLQDSEPEAAAATLRALLVDPLVTYTDQMHEAGAWSRSCEIAAELELEARWLAMRLAMPRRDGPRIARAWASVGALWAAWIAAVGRESVLEVQASRPFRAGRRRGARSRLYAAAAAYLRANPSATNEEVWTALPELLDGAELDGAAVHWADAKSREKTTSRRSFDVQLTAVRRELGLARLKVSAKP